MCGGTIASPIASTDSGPSHRTSASSIHASRGEASGVAAPVYPAGTRLTNIRSMSPAHTGSASPGSRKPPSMFAKSSTISASSGVPLA